MSPAVLGLQHHARRAHDPALVCIEESNTKQIVFGPALLRRPRGAAVGRAGDATPRSDHPAVLGGHKADPKERLGGGGLERPALAPVTAQGYLAVLSDGNDPVRGQGGCGKVLIVA